MLQIQDSLGTRILGRFGLAKGSLGAASASGAFWTTLGHFYGFGLRLLSTIILTRLLAPEVFGLMSLATAFMVGLWMFSDISVSPSVIRSHREDRDFLRTAWTMQVMRALLVCLCACLLAWPASRIYDEPALFPLLLVIGLSSLIDGFSSISVLVAQRRLELRRLTLIGAAVSTISTLCIILLVWHFRSIWGLVIGGMIGGALNLAASHLLLQPFPHAFRLERKAAMEILRFGAWIFLATLLTFVGSQGITLIQGTLVPLEILGLVALAGNIAAAPTDLVMKLLSSVLFPGLAQIARERPGDLRMTVARAQKLILVWALPLYFAVSGGSVFIVELVYDDRYAQAAEFLSILALGSALGLLCAPYQNAILAIGDGRSHSMVMGALAAFRVIGMLLGFQILDVWGMLVGLGAANGFVLLVSATVAHRRGFANPGLDAVALAILAAGYAWVMYAHVPL